MAQVKKSRKIILSLLFSWSTAALIVGPLVAIDVQSNEQMNQSAIADAFRHQLLGFNTNQQISSNSLTSEVTTILLPLSYVGPTPAAPNGLNSQAVIDQIWQKIGPILADNNGMLTYQINHHQIFIPIKNVIWQPTINGFIAKLVTTTGLMAKVGPFNFELNPGWKQAVALQNEMNLGINGTLNGNLANAIIDGAQAMPTLSQTYATPINTITAISPKGIPTFGQNVLEYKITNLTFDFSSETYTALATVLGVSKALQANIVPTPITNQIILNKDWQPITNVNHQIKLNGSDHIGLIQGSLFKILNAMIGLFYPQNLSSFKTLPHLLPNQLPCPWYSAVSPQEVNLSQLQTFFNQDFVPYFVNAKDGQIGMTTAISLPNGTPLTINLNTSKIKFVSDGSAFLMEYAGIKLNQSFTIVSNPLTALVQSLIRQTIYAQFKSSLQASWKNGGSWSSTVSPFVIPTPTNGWEIPVLYEYGKSGAPGMQTWNKLQFGQFTIQGDNKGTKNAPSYHCSCTIKNLCLTPWSLTHYVPFEYTVKFVANSINFQMPPLDD